MEDIVECSDWLIDMERFDWLTDLYLHFSFVFSHFAYNHIQEFNLLLCICLFCKRS